MSKVIVSDSSSLIMIGRLDRTDLLTNLFSCIKVPARVVSELTAKEDSVALRILQHPAFVVEKSKDKALLNLLDNVLDYGEAEAITIAEEQQLILLVDEKKARKIAKHRNLRIIGLLGVLLLNQRKGHLTTAEARTLLDQLKSMGFWLSPLLEMDFQEQLTRQDKTHFFTKHTLRTDKQDTPPERQP